MDEATAIEKVKEILDAREKDAGNQSSDKENELDESKKDIPKTYSKKANTALGPKQSVLATMNGTLQVNFKPKYQHFSSVRYSSSYLRRTNKLLTRPAKICVRVPIEGTECKI